jgi:hypothetical protein
MMPYVGQASWPVEPAPSWRTHSCVQRSHSCERVFACQPTPHEVPNHEIK